MFPRSKKRERRKEKLRSAGELEGGPPPWVDVFPAVEDQPFRVGCPVNLCPFSLLQQSDADAIQAAGCDRPKPLTSAQAGRTGLQGQLWPYGKEQAMAWAPTTQSPPAGRVPETGCHTCLPVGQTPALTFESKVAESEP